MEPQSAETGLIHDNQEAETPKDINLPTNPEIVASGVVEFETVYSALPDNLKSFFLDQKDLKTVFLGFTPQSNVYSLGELSDENMQQLLETIKAKSPTVTPCSAPRTAKDGSEYTATCLLNLKAAEVVINQNAEYFPPEAAKEPKTWLLNNPTQWWYPKVEDGDIIDIRFGLLSGFPIDSVLKYGPYWKARGSLVGDLSMEERMFIHEYKGTQCTEVDTEKLLTLLHKGNPNITSQEIDLIKNAKSISSSNTKDGYLGLSGEVDQLFQKESDKLYQQSGIEQLTHGLRSKITSSQQPGLGAES